MSNPSGFVIENGVLKKYTGPGGDAVIPMGVTEIGPEAFRGCTNLKSMTIHKGLKSIGDRAFCECRNLTGVTIPKGVISIGERAFENCRSLTSVAISEGVTGIGFRAFSGCSSLADVMIPDSVTGIGRFAFDATAFFTDINHWENGVLFIGNHLIKAKGSLSGEYKIREGTRCIADGAFYDCSSLTSVIIPEGVTRIGESTFWRCSGLTSVMIPESVTYIADGAFSGCGSLTRLSVPAKLKSLGKDPFGDSFPKCLIPELPSFLAPLLSGLTDMSLKNYLLTPDVWNNITTQTQIEIFILRHGKTLANAYWECTDARSAERIASEWLKRLTGNAAAKDCNMAAAFMGILYEKVPAAQLVELYDRLKSEKKGDKALKTVEDVSGLMDKINRMNGAGDSLSPVMQMVEETLRAKKRYIKDAELELRQFFGLTTEELPILETSDGAEADPHVLAWLLTAHESVKDTEWHKNIVYSAYCKPGLCPEAVEIAEMLDPGSLQKAIRSLAEEHLVAYQNTKKKFLAYPICRYADEATMAELTYRAPKWRTSVSGDDAPPLLQFRDAVKYSNTRAAMLFEERYGELDKYAALRGMTVDELRDKYLSDVGLDEHGGKSYDVGNQSVTARLQKDLSFLFELPGGKTSKSLPKKNADPEKYKAAKADFDEMRKTVKKVVRSRSDVLFAEFLSGRERPAAEWREAYLKNPLLRTVAELLVWEQGGKTFTLSGPSAIDATEQPYDLSDEPVRTAHPMEMDREEVKIWQKYFNRHCLKQPFFQIWEPVIDPVMIKADRYTGSVQPVRRFSGKDRHGIHSGNLNAYSEDIGFDLDGCNLDYDASTWRINPWTDQEATYTLGRFSYKTYTRQVNHIVSLLDRWTVEDRVKKDDVSVMDLMSTFTFAQVMEYIGIAQEAQAVNVLALLLEYKNTHFADFDPMDEFTLK